LEDQIEFSSSSTSNPEFQQKTHCAFLISNTNSPFKQNHNSKSSSFNSISQNHPNNQIPTTINSITFKLNHQSNSKHKLHNPYIYQNRNYSLINTYLYIILPFYLFPPTPFYFLSNFPLFSFSSSFSLLSHGLLSIFRSLFLFFSFLLPIYIYHLFIQLLLYPSFNYTYSLSLQGLCCHFLSF